MFTPSDLEKIPKEFEKLLTDAEMRIMEDIIRRITINGEITRSADWQIYRMIQLGESRATIDEIIKRTLKLTNVELDKLYDQVIGEGYTQDEELYKASGKDFIPYKDNLPLQNTINAVKKQTSNEFRNITQSLGFATKKNGKIEFSPLADTYQRILDNAMADISSGAFDYNKVLRRTIKEFTDSGLRTVDYATGWSNRVEVAVRRAVMTGVTQVTAQINEMNAQALVTDYFEVSWHATARPSHQVWQGKVFNREELKTICELGNVTGLCGANCYHSYYPFIQGISVRTYTDEQLDKMNASENIAKEYNGEKYTSYEATQRQRKLESLMRRQRQEIKLLEKGGADENDIINAKTRYRSTMAQYAEFSEQMGLPHEMQRVYADGLKNVGGRGKLANTVKNDIISTRIRNGEYSTKLSKQQYSKHVEGTKQYLDYLDSRILNEKTPQSIITVDADVVQELINKLSGTGIVAQTATGLFRNIEYVNADITIGKYFSNDEWIDTKRMAIHYSKKGSHIVPVKEEK